MNWLSTLLISIVASAIGGGIAGWVVGTKLIRFQNQLSRKEYQERNRRNSDKKHLDVIKKRLTSRLDDMRNRDSDDSVSLRRLQETRKHIRREAERLSAKDNKELRDELVAAVEQEGFLPRQRIEHLIQDIDDRLRR